MTTSPTPPGDAWFNPIAAHLGRAYWAPDTGRVMSFTKGTEQEVDFLVAELGLRPGARVLDVGCGPGRHALSLARRGFVVTGIDLSPEFVALARASAAAQGSTARFEVMDARRLILDGAFASAFDAVVCLCQGGFGLLGGDDDVEAFAGIARSACPGGAIAVSAFHAPFAVRHLEASESFDAATSVLHEVAAVPDEAGVERRFDLWTTCFTARELALLASVHDVRVDGLYGVAPGAYRSTPPSIDLPELLLVGRRVA